MAEYASSKWVPLQCLGRSEILTRMAEHAFSKWVPPSVWADQNHWQEWLNMHPGYESLPIVWADQNYWQEWLKICLFCIHLLCLSRSEPLTRMAEHASSLWVCPVFEQIRVTDKNIYLASKSLCSIWADINHWRWLILHLECNLLSLLILDVTSLTSFRTLIWQSF